MLHYILKHKQKKEKKKRKRKKEMIYRFKMADKLPISISCHFNFGKIKTANKQNKTKQDKNPSPKEFFNEIWIIIGDSK